MKHSRRLIWLPVAALLLPCAFLALLGYRWLALERDAAARRGAVAAGAAATALAGDLRAELQTRGEALAPVLDAEGRPAVPTPLSDAFLFDTSGHLLRPADTTGRSRVEDAARANALLAEARLRFTAGRRQEAARLVSQIYDCCPGARDEYATSFMLYAAWQQAAWYAASGTAEDFARLERGLQKAVDAFLLNRDEDVATMTALAARVPTAYRASFASLAQRVTDARDTDRRREAVGRAAAQWLSTIATPPQGASPVAGVSRTEGTVSLISAARVADDRVVVMLLDKDAIAAWIREWAASHGAFDIDLAGDTVAHQQARLVTPLFQEAPAVEIAVTPRALDPADTGRDRLFAAALVAALALTMLLGCLAVRDMTREIGTASLRSAFVASVTHELKTPVASIRLLAETLRHDRSRADRRHELLDTIIEESDRLTTLVDNVLTSSRIDSGMHAYHPRPVAPAAIVRSAIRRFDSVLTREGFVVTDEIGDGELRVNVDAEALERSVLNLLGNAIKYSGASRCIRVAVAPRDGHAEITVADHGIGVPPAERERIFELFYRSPAAAADSAGAGLGLALARHFVEAHHGRIDVRSAPEGGSVFSIQLPLLHGQDSDR